MSHLKSDATTANVTSSLLKIRTTLVWSPMSLTQCKCCFGKEEINSKGKELKTDIRLPAAFGVPSVALSITGRCEMA